MSIKPVTVWCPVCLDGEVHYGLACRTRKSAIACSYLLGCEWKQLKAEGYTVRKFKLVPVETKARGK